MENIINIKTYKEDKTLKTIDKSQEIIEGNLSKIDEDRERLQKGLPPKYSNQEIARMVAEMKEARLRSDEALRKMGIKCEY